MYLDFEKDKTENILNEINKYKDPELDKLEKRFIKLKQDIDYTLLENRYNNLINEDDNNKNDSDDDNNNSNAILIKKKIGILL